jgi:hypothetical protein
MANKPHHVAAAYADQGRPTDGAIRVVVWVNVVSLP